MLNKRRSPSNKGFETTKKIRSESNEHIASTIKFNDRKLNTIDGGSQKKRLMEKEYRFPSFNVYTNNK